MKLHKNVSMSDSLESEEDVRKNDCDLQTVEWSGVSSLIVT